MRIQALSAKIAVVTAITEKPPCSLGTWQCICEGIIEAPGKFENAIMAQKIRLKIYLDERRQKCLRGKKDREDHDGLVRILS